MPLPAIPAPQSFRKQIILTYVLGFFLLIAAFAAYLVLTERNNLHRDSVNKTTSMAQSLAASSLPWVLSNDVAGLQEIVKSFHAYPEFRYAMIVSPDGRVLAHSDASKVGMFLADEQSLAMLKSPHKNSVMEESSLFVDVAVPIEVNNHQVGWARVASTKQENAANLRAMIQDSIVFLLVSTTLSFIAARLIANSLGRRIGALVQVAEAVQAGNFSMRAIIPPGVSEITQLGNSLNKMLDTLSQNEHDLRAATHYTRSLIEASLDPLVTISAEGKITDVNSATERATGMSRAELIGTDFSDYFTEPDKARAGYRQVFAQGFVTDYPLTIRHRNGHLTDVLYNASVYRDEAGKVLGVFAAARDVTERNKAETALRESEALLHTTMEILPLGLWILDAKGNIVFGNEAAQQIWAGGRYVGLEQLGEYKGWRVDSGKPMSAHDWAGARALEKGETIIGEEVEIECFDGTRKIILDTAVPLRNADGSINGAITINQDITERKRAEEALRNSETRYRLLVESAPMCIHEIGMDGRITSMNGAGLTMMGVDEECKVQGLMYLDAVCEADRRRIGDLLAKAYSGEASYFEFKASGPGDLIFKSCFVPIKNQNGVIEKLMGITEDITERKLAEKEIREKEERLALATLINGVGIWDWNLSTQEMIWDDSMYALYHIRREDFIGTEEAWRKSLHPDDLARGDKEVTDAIAGIKPFDTEFRVVWPSGEIHHIKAVAKVFRDERGTPVRMLGTNMDITARKQVEQVLRESEEKFSIAFHASPDLLAITSADGVILDVNEGYTRMLGYTRDESKGKTTAELSIWANPADRDAFILGLKEFGQVTNFETTLRRKDSSLVTVIDSGRSIILQGKPCILSIAHDITERKKNEAINASRLHLVQFSMTHTLHELLEETLNEAEKLTGSLVGFYHFVDDDQTTLTLQCWSTRTRTEFCKAEGEGLHYPISEAGVWVDCVREGRAVIHNDYATLPHRKGMPEGHATVTRELVVPVFRGEKISAILGVGNKPSDYNEQDIESVSLIADLAWEIAERKKAEDQIVELNRDLENRVTERTAQLVTANKELEAFSYSVSHDLRSPLRAIDGFSHILLEDHAAQLDAEGKRVLKVVRENTVRMGQLINDILNFSRTGRLEMNPSEINMEALAREVYEELAPTAGHALQVEIGPLPPSRGDHAMMRQVFVNLISNAIKFTRASEPARIEVGAHAENQETVYFVKDNGAGFDMHYADRLFGVFQRLHTEAEFEGTGIGLAIVKRIITRHGGRAWAEGKIGAGATIYFALPAPAAATAGTPEG